MPSVAEPVIDLASGTIPIAIAPIPTRFLERARSAGIDALGQPVRRMIAKGGEPCRDVLRRAVAGEELILASFTPFTRVGPYKEYGPIFVLANGSSDAVNRSVLPMDGSVPYLRSQFVLRAYSNAEEILDAALVTPDDAASTLHRFLASEATAFVHARFPTYGCFACRIDRV